jgi:hypothetical protein
MQPTVPTLLVSSSIVRILLNRRTGEKYMAGRPYGPELLEEILTFVTLYWLTDTYPSSIYYYRYVSKILLRILLTR